MTKAARFLGVHPNTVRAWSDQGRIRYHRINDRGDRRYRLAELQRFLGAAEGRSIVTPPSERGRSGARGRNADAGTETGQGGRAMTPGAAGRSAVPASRVQRARTTPAPLADTMAPLATASIAPRAEPAGEANGTSTDAGRLPLTDGLDAPEAFASLGRLADLAARGGDLDELAEAAVASLHRERGHPFVAVLEHRDGRLVPRAIRGATPSRFSSLSAVAGVAGRAMERGLPVTADAPGDLDGLPAGLGDRLAAPIMLADSPPWGVLVVADDTVGCRPLAAEAPLVDAVAHQLACAVAGERLRHGSELLLHRAEALHRIATDLAGHLDPVELMVAVAEHARVLFGGDRAGVFLGNPDGSPGPHVAQGLSAAYLAAVLTLPLSPVAAEAIASGRPVFATGFRDDPRATQIRAAVVQEGFDTVCAAPMLDVATLTGVISIYHDRLHAWTPDELETLAAFAGQAATSIANAQRYTQMATWAVQLQSIQQLGARLSRFTTPAEVGQAIATEIQLLIDYHNVRVYRLVGDDLVPVAMKGRLGEYEDETPEQLEVKVGEGITGWVAAHKMPQYLPDANADARTVTVPGSDDDFEESMLLAPMIYEDQVLGVIVLSKVGRHQFTDDHLRLLVIYASLAGQAMANADAAERLRRQSAALERQLQSQRALLGITESILLTLDPQRVLEEVTDHLSTLIRWDNICIELTEPSGLIRPIIARGVHAAEYAQPWRPGEEGLATWVVRNAEPQLVPDELADPRIQQFETTGPMEGSIICVPLLARAGVIGVLTVERLGWEDRFDEDEFELVKLFGGHVAIALQNAEAHQKVQVRAETDSLTGLLNLGTFQQWLARSVAEGGHFSLLMLDMDNFKQVNDAMGHQAGNELLAGIATTIVQASRDSDRAFRYGGDEFAVILPATDRIGALAAAERIRQALRGSSLPGPRGMAGVTASTGVATFPADGTTTDLLLLAADRACFVAKRGGRDRIATAEQGLALAAEFRLKEPTPVDSLADDPTQENPAPA